MLFADFMILYSVESEKNLTFRPVDLGEQIGATIALPVSKTKICGSL